MLKEYAAVSDALLVEAPSGWLEASLPKIIENNNKPAEQRWTELTGVKPIDTHFTIIIPIHNEARCLPSVIDALTLSYLPLQADIQIIFVVNDSSDQSYDIIHRYFQSLAPVDTKQPHDPLIVQKSNIKYVLFNTKTAGRANALTIGNEFALKRNHLIALNIDANNWPEPDSIAKLFKLMYKTCTLDPQSQTVLVGCQVKNDVRSDTKNVFLPYMLSQQNLLSESFSHRVKGISGAMFAWNTQWIANAGGFPSVVLEDYAIAIEAYQQEKNIIHSDATIWAYENSTPSDRQQTYTRYLLGALQILQKYQNDPKVLEILQDGFPMLRPLGKRLEHFYANRNPLSVPINTIKWVLGELRLMKAKSHLKKDPYQQSWSSIRSTK